MAEQTPQTGLDQDQARRAEAVDRAGRALTRKSGMTSTPGDAREIEALAVFILTGDRQLRRRFGWWS